MSGRKNKDGEFLDSSGKRITMTIQMSLGEANLLLEAARIGAESMKVERKPRGKKSMDWYPAELSWVLERIAVEQRKLMDERVEADGLTPPGV